ncbi:MAG: radical SAM protein [Candidatus Omnitrophica bacterium]|nr:radical SAM protein [Candidatus Omnitrophota bacterium]
MKKEPYITRLDIELTERCNNNCIHCYINLPDDDLCAKKKELSTDKIKEILKEAVSLDCMTIRFTGGEPLLREDFEELYVFTRKQGLKVLIFTNATLINKRLAELFSRIPPLEKIEVTVYGINKNSYEAVTGKKGSFKAAEKGIKLLLKNKIPFVVKSAVLPPNKNETDKFEKWAMAIPDMDRLPSKSMFFDLRCRRDNEIKNRFIKKLRITPEEGIGILTREKDKYIKEMKEFCSKFTRPPGDDLFSCGAGFSGCADAYGYFLPCIMLKCPDTAYDLKNGTLEDAIVNFFPKIRAMRAKNKDYLKRCAKCFLKSLCEQCPAKSWMEHGTLDTPVEYFCEIAHAQAKFLGLVKPHEKAWEVTDWKERLRNFSRNVIPAEAGIQT